MKSSWTLLAVIVVLFSVLLRTVTSEWQNTDGGVVDVEDRGDEENFKEFEDKMIRTWIKHFTDKYYKNIQLSAKSANIQRIAKKSRTSASSAIPVQRNAAPLPVYPVIFKPYYPTVYSSFIPLSHSPATTHLIPISHEEYYQRFLTPFNTHYTYGYTHFPDIASSTPVNNNLNIKKPCNVQVYTPQNNEDEIRKYDKPDEILIDAINKELSNQNPYDFDQTLPTGFGEPEQIDTSKYEENENPNLTRYGKLLDNVDSPPKPVATQPNQTTESQKGEQNSVPLDTTNKLDTSTPKDKIVSPEVYNIHVTPTFMTPIVKSSSSEILNDLVSQLPMDAKYHSSNTLSTTTQYSSEVFTTQVPSSSALNINESETTVEEKAPTTTGNSYFNEGRSNSEEKNQQGKSQDAEHEVQSSNNTVTGISKPPIKTDIKTVETIEMTQNTDILSTLLTSSTTRPTTIFHSTTLCENNDCRGLKSSHLTTPSTETTVHVNAYDSSIPVKTINSTTQSTRINSEYDNRTNLVSTSTRPSSTPTTISETTTMSYKTSPSSTILKLSSLTTQEISITPSSFYFRMPPNQINEIKSTSLHYTSSTPKLQPLSNNSSTIQTLIQSKIEQTLSTTTDKNNNTINIKRNANIPMNSEKSTISPLTTTISSLSIEPIIKTDQITVPPSNISKSSIKQIVLTRTTTEKVNSNKNDKIDQFSPVTIKETITSTFKPIVTQIKTRSSTPRTLIIDTDGSKYRNSAPNRDRYMAETTQSSQTTKDSDLWYSHMNTQSSHKKELNDQEVDYLLKKLIKLLKPEIEKQSLSDESIRRFISPKLGDREKLVYIIFPMIRDEAKNISDEEKRENRTSLWKNVDQK